MVDLRSLRPMALSDVARDTVRGQYAAGAVDGQPVQNGHAELSARYRWQCAQPERLKSVGTTLFADYKRLHKIKAVFAGPRGQHAATLGRKTPTFRW